MILCLRPERKLISTTYVNYTNSIVDSTSAFIQDPSQLTIVIEIRLSPLYQHTIQHLQREYTIEHVLRASPSPQAQTKPKAISRGPQLCPLRKDSPSHSICSTRARPPTRGMRRASYPSPHLRPGSIQPPLRSATSPPPTACRKRWARSLRPAGCTSAPSSSPSLIPFHSLPIINPKNPILILILTSRTGKI
ncbi:uncharacterized protein BO72DRAFT_30092, partial [Aspergillus fijiensis CBS 313.89]